MLLTDWVYNEEKFVWLMALESEKPRSLTLAPDGCFKLYHLMTEGRRATVGGNKRARGNTTCFANKLAYVIAVPLLGSHYQPI